MRCLYDREESRRFDREAEERFGMPTLLLMENAGRGAAELIAEEFSGSLERVVIIGGAGQNGGDAWVVARHLLSKGAGVVSYRAVDEERIKGDARVNYDILSALDRAPRPVASVDAIKPALEGATLIVDGLFGTGLSRPIEGKLRAIIEAMNAARAPIVSLDLPSGIDCDTGERLGAAVEASLTIAFLGEKRGLIQSPGRGAAGTIRTVSLGLPSTIAGGESRAKLLELSDVAEWWKPRAEDTHKGVAGHIAVYGGSAEKPGAALLAGMGALRSGAGLVSLIPPPAAEPALAPRMLEMMFERRTVDELPASFHRKDAGLIGPGLGDSAEAEELIERIIFDFPKALVIDADALNYLARKKALPRLREAAGPRILTPHPREAARLLGVETREIQRDRYRAASLLAERSGQAALLKGAGTIIAAPGGALYVSPFSEPSLGTGGTGDVLSGIIAALLVDHPPLIAASMGALIHIAAAREASALDRGMLASELAAAIPKALRKLLG